jgi:hypothetical protein
MVECVFPWMESPFSALRRRPAPFSSISFAVFNFPSRFEDVYLPSVPTLGLVTHGCGGFHAAGSYFPLGNTESSLSDSLPDAWRASDLWWPTIPVG